MKRVLFAALFVLALAHGIEKKITWDSGEVRAPTKDQLAEITLLSGDLLVARKLHEEDDTVYAVLITYDFHSIPVDEIAQIRIRPILDSERAIKPERVSKAGMLVPYILAGTMLLGLLLFANWYGNQSH